MHSGCGARFCADFAQHPEEFQQGQWVQFNVALNGMAALSEAEWVRWRAPKSAQYPTVTDAGKPTTCVL